MTLTAADQAIRKGRITASVAADILHEGAFGTELTAWLAIMDLPREDIGKKNEVRAGNLFESGVCQWWHEDVGIPNGLHLSLVSSGTLVHPVHDWLAATPDRFVLNEDNVPVAVLQAKTSGYFNREKWEDLDTHETIIPDGVIIQVQIEMEVADLPRAYVAAVLGGNRPYFAQIERDRKMGADLITVLGAWHKKHVVGNMQPEPTGKPRDTRAFRYLHPDDSGEIVSLSEEGADHARVSERLVGEIQAKDEERDRLRNLIRAEMGTATFGEAPGIRAIYKTNRKGVRSLNVEVH